MENKNQGQNNLLGNMLAGFFNGNNSLPSIDESGELVINENDAKFVVNEDNLPSAIFGAIDTISSLEKKIRQSSDEAKAVLDYINNDMKRYKNKSLFGFGYRSGNTEDIIEDLQKAVKQLAESNHLSFLDVHVRQGIRKDMPGLKIEHKPAKEALMNYINNK